MSTTSLPQSNPGPLQAELCDGMRMDQATFHRLYAGMPEGVKSELIDGVVHMPPASMKRPHGQHHGLVVYLLKSFEIETPGVESLDNTTTILGPNSEPQPDAYLYILSEHGGQVRFTDDEYIEGPPEFVAEVSDSTESIDLNAKKLDYERAGVREYLVVALQRQQVIRFVLKDGKFQEVGPDDDGTIRSAAFPGLWIDSEALLALDGRRLREVLQHGVASPEHAAFVDRLNTV